MGIAIYIKRISRYLEGNIIEDLGSRSSSYAIVGEFLSDLKEEFGGEDDETIKIAELKKIE